MLWLPMFTCMRQNSKLTRQDSFKFAGTLPLDSHSSQVPGQTASSSGLYGTYLLALVKFGMFGQIVVESALNVSHNVRALTEMLIVVLSGLLRCSGKDKTAYPELYLCL